jgi:hypothetical protein
MKKISAVLLILALVGGAVFASFTGSAGVSFGFDLDSKDYGFKNPTALEADVTFLERLVDNAGEGDIYAEIKAELALAFVIDDDYDWTDYDTFLDLTAKVTSAKIIGDNWFVGILGAAGAPNFAASAIDFNADDEALDLAFDETVGAGITVGFADYTFGLAIPYDANNIENKEYNVFLSALTPEYEFADGLTGKFGVAGLLADDYMGGFASLEVGFAQDDLTVSLASDLSFAKDEDFGVEVAVAAGYDFIDADLYYALKDYDGVYGGAAHILSVQLGAEIEGFDITVGGLNLVNKQDLYASVDYDINEQFSVGVNGGYVIADKVWSAGGNVKYTHDIFTATASVGLEGADELDEVIVKVGASSDKLVGGATLALDYVSGNLAADPAVAGTIVAKATIEF